jgi:branched-chain amino acid transport system substrate-binding protein
MRRFLFPTLSILIVASMILAGCGPTPTEMPTEVPTEAPTEAPTSTPPPEPTGGEPDLTGETIKFYAMGDLSGPYAATTASLVNGAKDLLAYTNETGGIFGATIELRFEDTGGKVDQAVSIYDRYTGEDDNILMLMLFSSLDEQALWERVKEDQVPTIGSAPDATALYSVKDGWMFSVMPIYSDQLGYFLDYVAANWSEIKPEGAGDEIKFAHLSWPGGYGQSSLTDETKAHMEKLGIELVANETYEISPQADTTTAILNAQAAGANVAWTNTLGFGVANLLSDMAELGVRDQFVVGTNMLGMDVATYAFLPDPSYADGLYASFPFVWWPETDNPGVQFALEVHRQYEREERDKALGRLISQSSTDVAIHAVKQAILEVGYENLTGQAVYNVLSQIKDYQVMGGLTTVDYTNSIRAGRQLQIRQIQGGLDKFVILKDFAEAPDLRVQQ